MSQAGFPVFPLQVPKLSLKPAGQTCQTSMGEHIRKANNTCQHFRLV